MRHRYLIGIDEAGRGPLAGPVAVGAVMVKCPISNFQLPMSRGTVRDSKQLSAQKRERIFGELKRLKKAGRLNFAVSLIGHTVIDERGIVAAIRLGVARCLRRLCQSSGLTVRGVLPKNCLVLLDGGLRAPENYQNQITIIKGDEKEMVIALASIVAKVSRDRQMVKLAKKYPDYALERHKGYGTRAHYLALAKHGHSLIHRRSFLTAPAGIAK